MAISDCRSLVDSRGKELLEHGTSAFPIACYHDDLGHMEVPWHWHEEWEAVVISSGRALIAAGSDKFEACAGEGFFIQSGVVHACWDLEGSGCRFHSLVFQPGLVGGSLDSVYDRDYVQPVLNAHQTECLHLKPDVPWQEQTLAAIERAWQCCAAEEAGYEMHVRAALTEMTWLIGRHLSSGSMPGHPKAIRDGERLKRMLEYIDVHLAQNMTASQIARAAAISESECLRCFHATIGITPIQYVRRLRIRKAAARLASTEEPVAQIAADCGFQDLSYFAKTFKEAEGCTPTAYREKKRR